MPLEQLSIAQVTPYAWEAPHEVNLFAERLSEELCARGHRVVVIAPSESRDLVREGRSLVGRMADDPEAIWAEPGCARVLAVGQTLPLGPGRHPKAVQLPLDVARTIEQLLERASFDLVHVHEPFAPSAASVALRHSRALNVGSFHSATERVLSTQVARRLVELVFGRLDGRTASWEATRDLVARFFPGDYRLIHPGADLGKLDGAPDAAPEIVYAAEEERGALRLLLRALRRLPPGLNWRATIWSRLPGTVLAVPAAIRDRVRVVGPADGSASAHLAGADIAVAASTGAAPAPGALLRALGAGAIPVASRIPEHEEALAQGDRGLLFEPRDAETLSAQLARLITDHALAEQLRERARADRDRLSWGRAADQVEGLYASVLARRRSPDGSPAIRRRLADREIVHVDLHMHTNHSPDCATPVETLLETAQARGLQAIAVTDHNEVSGALEARAQADGIQVVVGEEIKTADQGEVIGLFLEELVPRGLTLEATIAEIRRQGGLVYVPHPFDRMHTVPDYEHLLGVVEEIDAIEVFNPRVAFSAFNEEAARFAAKYRIPAGAGSDAHVAQGLGSVKIRMRRFDGPQEFIESLREADIIRRRQSLLYVQALKFLQTKTSPSRPARAARDRDAAAGAAASKE